MNRVTPVTIAEQRQAAATAPAASVWVSASAGSGKTKVLTDRVLALLLAGHAPERILCLTFTKAAAAEMSNRIAERLSHWVTAPDAELEKQLARLIQNVPDTAVMARARQLFARVLDAPGGLRILTIHAFCQSVLRRFPLEAEVAPHFTVMDERDTASALAMAQDATIADARSESNRNKTLADALAIVTERVHELHFGGLMAALVASRAKLANALARHKGADGLTLSIRKLLGVGATENEDSIIRAACADTAFARDKLEQAAQALERGSATDGTRGASIRTWIASVENRGTGFAEYCKIFLTQEDLPRALKSLATKQAQSGHAGLAQTMLDEADRLAAVIARLKAVRVATSTAALVRLGAHLLSIYEADKSRRCVMDYDDLIGRTRKLLEKPGNAGWVLFKLDGGIDHVLIDEAQDTNPEQWAIVRALTAEFFAGRGRHEERTETARTVFAVGDRKQSIYGFQGADPDQFDIVQTAMRTRVETIGQPWQSIALNVSFRSTPAVLHAVDAVFRAPEARDGLGDEVIAHLPAREGEAGLVEIWQPVLPAATDEPPHWKPPVERKDAQSPPHRLAGLIAGRIARMIRNREFLEAKGRPIRAGDIMVLVRRRTGFVRELVRQLKALDIPVAGVDRMVLTEQLAVMDLIALGQFLLLPDDDLTLACVLKGPLLGLTEEELFILAHERRGTLWESLSIHAGSDSRFGAAQAYLADLLAQTDYLPPAQLFGRVLATDGRRKILGRLGAEADDPIDEFLNLAHAYQRTHAPSLQGFLHWIVAGNIEVKRDLQQSGSDAVRVITAHGAKGLQAPIVFLPDTLQIPTFQDRLLWSGDDVPLPLWAPSVSDQDPVTRGLRDAANDTQLREYRRLLYVAMTRAEDRLYVCGWQNRRPQTCGTWHALISAGVSQLAAAVTETDAFLAEAATLPSADVLRFTSPQIAEAKPEPSTETKLAAAALPTWAYVAPDPEPAPPVPLAPSTAMRRDPAVFSPLSDDGTARFRRGTIIHRLLQSLPDIPKPRRADAAAAFLKRRSFGLTPDEQAQLAREAQAVIDHPAFAPLFGPQSRAEVPLTGLVGKHAISAQVDRLAVTDDDVWVIDYKTNRPPPHRTEDVDPAYVYQMATYHAALRAIYPNRRVHAVLLWTDGPFILELEPAQLDEILSVLS